MKIQTTPTHQFYEALQLAYQHFNHDLFEGLLPLVLFTPQQRHNTLGYFRPKSWVNKTGEYHHEIAINAIYLAQTSLVEILATLVHEMVHCWQDCYGKPSRRGYHNQEWANKMKTVGLMPSSTAQVGGKEIGQCVSHYILADGRFIKSCVAFIKKHRFDIPWIYSLSKSNQKITYDNIKKNTTILRGLEKLDEATIKQLTDKLINLYPKGTVYLATDEAKKTKIKYSCPCCHANVWGKPALKLQCLTCNEVMHCNTK